MRLQDLLAPQDKFLKQYVGGCSQCPRKLQDFVPATLRPTKMIIVGEFPGATEVEKQEYFKGKSGQILRAALKDVGVTEDLYSLTSTIHCRPAEGKDPKDKEISCCMNEHVMHEVSPYPLVVLAGSVPTNAFFPGHAQAVRGNLAYHPDFETSRFFSILHPASIGYDSKKKDEFYRQIDRLARIYRGQTEVSFHNIMGEDFRTKWSEFLQSTAILSLDLETDRLESWAGEGKIKSLAACAVPGEEVFSIDNSDPYWQQALQLLKAFLQNPEKQVLGQNIGFDLVWLEEKLQFKCDLKYIHELSSIYYQLRGDKYTALKPLVSEELDGYRHLVVWPHLEKNVTHLKKYGGEDVYYPQKLFLRDFPKLRPKTKDLYLKVLGPSSLATRRITHAGIYFRSEGWEALNLEYSDARSYEIAAWAAEDPYFDPKVYVTDKGFKDLDFYLYQVRKFPVLNYTEKDQKPSTDDATIKELIRLDGKIYNGQLVQGTKCLEHCLKVKGIDKRRSTYILALPKHVTTRRRIHSNYNNTVTSTGRLSSTSPNMQNNPRNSREYKNQIRWLFGAPPGSKFLGGDFSQIELRIAMCLAGDPTGIQMYRDGGDAHATTGNSMIALKGLVNVSDELFKEYRTKAKPVNFGLIYGGGWEGLQAYAANQYGVMLSDAEAKEWVRIFFQTYSKLPEWHAKEIQKLRENKGYLESAVGHVWYYPDWDSPNQGVREHAERSAINCTCQGPAGYFMIYLIYLCQQEFWKKDIRANGLQSAEVVLTVHDSLEIEVNQDQVVDALAIVNNCLHVVSDWIKDWFTVPLILDTKVVEVWDGK